ncbi:hypothetical protein Tco_1246165 [Tanacetum coccineum]
MARRRHGNHADMQFVFIPQTKPGTLAHSERAQESESDVTMARRRHGNHADMQFVFIPQTKPDTVAHGHTWGKTDVCLSVCMYHTAVLTGALKNRRNIQKLPEQEFTSTVIFVSSSFVSYM